MSDMKNDRQSEVLRSDKRKGESDEKEKERATVNRRKN